MLPLFARFFLNLLWIFGFAETLKLPSTHVQLCSEVPLWCSESPFSVPRLGESQLPSTKHLPCSSAFALLYSSFLNIFSPSDLLLLTLLNLCPDLYLMLPWNIIHRKHLAVPLLYGTFFQRIISVSLFFVLAQSLQKSFDRPKPSADPDHPPLSTPEAPVVPAVSTCSELAAVGTGAFVRFAFFPFSLLCQSHPLEKELQVARRRWGKMCSTLGSEVCDGDGDF